jgi:ABC-type antimicrobial peptide transport system permease subunit
LILNDAVLLSGTGVGIGAIGAILVSHSIQALLFGIAATDSRIYIVVAAAVVAVALLSSFAPALRAGSMSPSILLRQE